MLGSVFIAVAFLAGPARATSPVPPASPSLTVSPAFVTWPTAPGFEYRLSVASGPDGGDFSIRFPYASWGPADIGGTPFESSEAVLDGPGTLAVESMVVADPSPTSCYRGGFGSPEWAYRLTLPPNSQTVVRMSSKLLAPPVHGMDGTVTAEISRSFGPGPSVLTAGIGISGPVDPRIVGKVRGSSPDRPTVLRPAEDFRITGRTEPVLKNRLLEFHAEPRSGSFGSPGSPIQLAKVKTNESGRFRTPPIALRKPGTWVLTSRVGGATEISFSCNGAVEVGRKAERATVRNLDGRQFVSTSVAGPGEKPDKVKLAFIRGTVYGDDMEVVSDNGPIMVAHPGCNIMGAGYQVRKGRLRWIQPATQTLVGCPGDRDGWMSSRLRVGMKVAYAGETLVLKGKRGALVRLKPRHWFGPR